MSPTRHKVSTARCVHCFLLSRDSASTRQRTRQSHQHTLDTRVQGELAQSANVLGHKSHLCCATTGLQRTAFMHLRTANQRHGRKKVAAYSRATDELPSTKHLVHRATSSSRARASPLRKKKPYKGASPLRSTSAISRRIALRNASNGPNRNPTISSNRPRSHESQTTSSTGTGKATLHNKRQIDPSDESPSKKQHISPEEGDNAKLKARTNNRVDVFHSPPPKGDKGRRIAINTNAGTSNPFANLLSKTPTPSGNSAKENRSLW